VPNKTFTLLTPILAFAHLALFGAEDSTTVLDLIRAGAPSTGLIETLGEPISVEQHEGLQVSTFARPEAGIATVTTWCDQEGVIQWARIRLVNDLPPSAVRLLYTFVGGTSTTPGHAFADTEREEGRTEHHETDGVHLFIADEVVREIWCTAPRADLTAIRTAAKAHWPSVRPAEVPTAEMADGIPNATLENRNQRPLLSVGPIDTQVVQTPEGYAAQITGTIHAAGFEGQEILILGFFYRENGTEKLHAVPTAPAELRGSGGEILVRKTDTVQHADAVWNDLILQVPLNQVEGFGNLYGRFVLRMEVHCGGKAAFCTGEIDLRRPDTPPARPDRQVRIGGEPWVEEWTAEEDGPGLMIHIPVEVNGCLGLNFGCRVALRHLDGTPVQASSDWDNWRTSKGDFYAFGLSEVEFKSSSWTPYNIFVPYAALDLAPGEQTLVVRLAAFCENVGTVLEFDTTIVKP